jgi:hypothetical protein
MGTLKEIFLFIINTKKWWLVPVLLALLLIALLVTLSSSPTIAPFIYTIF